MDICRKYGVVPESMLPFRVDTLMYAGDENTFYASAAQYKASAYFNLGKELGQWRAWLASAGPIMAGVRVDATWDAANATHGILDAFQPNTVRGGHAICIVGYDDKARLFKFKNSWSDKWGAKGYGYLPYDYMKKHLMDAWSARDRLHA